MKKANKEKRKTIRKTVVDILDERKYDTDHKCFVLKDETYMDIMQIKSKDLINSSEDEVEYDCLRFAKTYRLYADDLKIICLNFPCDYSEQKRFLEYKIKKTRNNICKEQLNKKLQELIWLERHDTTREYYYMIFADTPEQMEKNILTISSNLGSGRGGLIERISEEKKIEILFRIRNKSCLIKH